MKTVHKLKSIGLFLALIFVFSNSMFALEKKNPSSSATSIETPLLKTQWGQRIGRLQFSPNREGGSCVPVALAQIFYSLDIPVQGSKSYSTSKGIYWRDFDANPTQYSSLPLSFDDDKATDAQMKGYDNFLYNCAIVMNHAWENAEIHQEGFSKRVKAHIPVEVETFYYGYSNHTNLTKQEFQDKIIECLRVKKPVMYSIYSADKVLSHAVVIDAARTSGRDFQVHINFGWNGDFDGWYDLWSPILVEDYTVEGGYRRYDSEEKQLTVLTPLIGAAKAAWEPERLSAEQIRNIQNETRKVPEIVNGTLYIPEGTSYLYYDNFKNNRQIQKIKFPSTFKGTTKDTNLFEGCVNLKEIEFGEAMERLSENTFLNCTKLEKIIYGGKWTDHAYTDAFKGCTNLTTAEFTSTCQVIPSGMFWKVKTVKDVTIAEGVEAINYGAFYDTSIAKIQIPSTVKEIDSYAFYKTLLKEVYVPSSVVKMGDTVFSKSVKIICDEGSYVQEWAKKNGYKYEIKGTAANTAAGNTSGSTSNSPSNAVSNVNVTKVYTEPFLKTQWGQRDGKLQFAPDRESATCAPVALAQMLYYLGLPIQGSKSYATTEGVYWRDFDANPTTYKKLPLTYSDDDDTDAQMKDYDNFLYNCSILLDRDWKDSDVNSLGFEKCVKDHVPATVERYDYANGKNRDIPKQEFQDKIIECLGNKIPLYYAISSEDDKHRHAVIIDGARDAGQTFQVHLNFGWHGKCDGWYNLWAPILVADYTEESGYRRYDAERKIIMFLSPLNNAARAEWKPFKLTSEQIRNIQNETRKVPVIENGILYFPEGTAYSPIDYKNDKSITKIKFPSTFRGNGFTEFTFGGCTNIKELEFPKSTDYLVGKTFLDCTGLEKVTYNGEWTDRNFTDAFKGCTNLKTAVFTSSCKVVPSHIFRNVTSLTDVTLSQGIQSIGYGAFWNCSNLVNFEIPSSVKEIGGYAFYNIGLKEIYVPSSVKKIEDNAFSKSVKIICDEGSYAETWAKEKGYTTKQHLDGPEYTIANGVLTFNNQLKTIAASQFKGNTEIREVVIGENITKIGNSAFEGCPNLKKIQFNAKNVEMNNSSSVSTFKNCPVEELVFGPKVEVVPRQTFRNLNSLKSVRIPGNVKEVQMSAFYGDKALEEIVIEEGCESLVEYCFYGAPLKKLTLPASIKSIEANAVPKSAKVICPENSYAETWARSNGFTIEGRSASSGSGTSASTGGTSTTSSSTGTATSGNTAGSSSGASARGDGYTITNGKLTFDSSVTSIAASQFKGNSEIREVVIGENITSIGKSAFEGCANLKKIQFNAINVEMNNSQSVNTFKDCPVEELVFGPKVQVVPRQTFRNLNSLKYVKIPGNVKEIQQSAFYGDKAIEEIFIEEGVETLVQYCFYGLPLKKITLPSSIRSIEANALPKSVEVICPANSYAEDFALQNGNEVPSAFNLSNGVLTIKEGIKTIPEGKYMGNTQIRELVIPSTVTKIGGNAFKNCTSLMKVTYKAVACTSAGNGGSTVTAAFVGCTKLSQVIIAEGVTTIPANIFRECPALKNVIFPSSLKKINSSAFYKTAFEELVIPEGLEEISYTCFSSNSNLKTVRLPSSVTSIQNNAFDKRGVKFYVKSESYAEQWCKSQNVEYIAE